MEVFKNMNIIPLQFNKNNNEPLYLQLFHYLKELILNDKLPFGSKLPPIRTFAKALNVNNITVINAYKQLETSGYITSKRGSGFYVSKHIKADENTLPASPINHEDFINFSSASPHPSIFPTETFKEYIVEAIERDKGFAFGYQEINGFMPLRQVLADFLLKTYQIETSSNLIQIVSGAQQGLDIIGKSLLYAGDSVITENPTYNGALDVFKSRGCRIVPVKLKKHGIDLIELEKKVRICKPKLIYIMPNYQNPTTICYDKQTLIRLLELARTYDFYILEEDSMCELCYTTHLPLSLKSFDTDDRVIYLKSFSKLLMPGLRMGFIIMPSSLSEAFTKTKQTTDISTSGLIQRALELYFRNNKWDEHIHYMKEIYRGKYEFMLSKLEQLKEFDISFSPPHGGLFFWLHLPPSISASALYKKCYEHNVLLLASSIFYPDLDPSKDCYVRISFANCTIDDIQKGFAILYECLKALI